MNPESIKAAIEELQRDSATLTDDDRERLNHIAATVDQPAACAQLIWSYYKDRDRADRTPRGIMYLHVGMLVGMFHRQ